MLSENNGEEWGLGTPGYYLHVNRDKWMSSSFYCAVCESDMNTGHIFAMMEWDAWKSVLNTE